MSKGPSAPPSRQMNAGHPMSTQQQAAQSQSAKKFGRIGIPAVAAASEFLKFSKPEAKPQANPYYLRDYD